MKLLIATILVFGLYGCAGAERATYNPLEGPFGHMASEELILKNPAPNQLQAFVSGVIGEQKNAWWTMNQQQTSEDGVHEVMDITIHIGTGVARFVIGMKNGQIEMVKNIEPEAEVDCQHEGESFKNGA